MTTLPFYARGFVVGCCCLTLACTIEETPGPASRGGSGAAGMSGAAGSAGAGSTGGAGQGGSSAGGTAGSPGSGGASGGSGGAGGSQSGGSGGSPAGGANAGGGGSGGAPTSFEPCPQSGECKILPLGDSITDGFGTQGGYRIPLFQLTLDANQDITFVGSAVNGPTMVGDQPFPRNHEGHSGWTIQQIDDIVEEEGALDVDPHIILLHIGTNDMVGASNGAADRLGTLIEHIVARAPDALLVVAQIIPMSAPSSVLDAYNAAIPALVQEQAALGKHVIMVDHFTNFPENGLDDFVHPNPVGYSFMADVWYAAISSYL